MEIITDTMINNEMVNDSITIQDEMFEIPVTESGKTKNYTLYQIIILLEKYVLTEEKLKIWENAIYDASYDPKYEFNIDEMNKINYRYCRSCNHWVQDSEEWEKENDTCIDCAENDDQYLYYRKQQNAEDSYYDLKSDILSGK